MSDAVVYRRSGAVGVITLSRPDNRNSMTAELLDAFTVACAAARDDAGARCVVITGEGACFSAGADFKAQLPWAAPGRVPGAAGGVGASEERSAEREHRTGPHIDHTAPGRQPHERSYAMYEPFLGVLDVEVPVIGALNGHAVGGGFGLALVCDLRVASRDARYGANFTRLGLHPGMAISYLLPRLVGVARAAELLFTGRLVTGAEAAAMGLASEALPATDVLPRAMELAEQIAGNAPIAVRMTKRSLYEALDWQPRAAAFREAFAQATTLATADATEGMSALLEKRDPTFRGE